MRRDRVRRVRHFFPPQATLSPGLASQLRVAFRLRPPRGASLQLSLRSTGSWCRISPREVQGLMPAGVNGLLRIARSAVRRGTSIATVIGRIVFVAIALLIVTVGVLATESRLPNPTQNTTAWHMSKSSRMAECGGDELVPVQTDDSRPAPPIITTAVTHYFLPIELPLQELAGAPQAHGLRAPPRA